MNVNTEVTTEESVPLVTTQMIEKNNNWELSTIHPNSNGKKKQQTSGRHISTEEDACVRVAELEESGGPLGLLLLPVDAHHGQVDVVEQLVVELDRHAGGEEHHHLQGDSHQARRSFS
jgi:hypothetical protein